MFTPEQQLKKTQQPATARPKPAQAVAAEWLTKAISGVPWKPGDRLPNMRELASMAGVSLVVMSRAVHELRDQQRVHVRLRKGIIAGPDPAVAVPMPMAHPTTKFARVRQLMARDILDGRFDKIGALPSTKELMAIYGVSPRTLEKILRHLQDDCIIVHDKKLWRLRHEEAKRCGSTICVFSPFDFAHLAHSNIPHVRRQSVFLQMLEQECIRQSITLSIQTYTHNHPPVIAADTMGFILWAEPDPGEATSRILSSLLRWQKPVFILDEGAFDTTARFPAHQLITVFRIDCYRAGYEMGTFLIGKGHRHACFFGLGREYYDIRRESGLAAAFREYQGSFSAYHFHDYKTERIQRYATSEDRKADEAMGRSRDARQDLVKKVQKMPLSQQDQVGLSNEIMWNYYEKAYQTGMLPLIRCSLEEAPHATVWIGTDDMMALHSLCHFLEHEGHLLGHPIAVAGFDGSVDSFFARMTSYTFDMAGCATRMVNLLLNPRHIRKFVDNRDVVPVPGFVSWRQTLWPSKSA